MPEGDTVLRTARRLHQALAGEVLEHAETRWGEIDASALRGCRTLEVVPRGKHLLHRVEGGVTVHTHLRMEGRWEIAASGSPPAARGLRSPQLRAAFGTSRWTALGLRLGLVELVPTAEEDRVVGHLGPDVLGPDWDVEAATSRLRKAGVADPTLGLAAALLDQRHLAGVGTFWASEVLFVLSLHPWQPVAATDDDTLRTLVTRVARMMEVGARKAVQSSTGELARGRTSYVHARSGRACRRCGSTVRVALAGQAPRERTIFSCPTCQGGLAPTDHGRPQRPLGSGRRR